MYAYRRKQNDTIVTLPREGIIKYAAEMASCGRMYMPNFMKIGRGVQKVVMGEYIHTNSKKKKKIS
jgi:hypothetical protein